MSTMERPEGTTRSPAGQDALRAIIEQLADGVVVVGRDGAIRFANPAAERLFRRDAAALRDVPFGVPAIAGEAAEIEIVRPGGQGVVTAELRAVDILWDGEPAALLSLRDVTDRKTAEHHREQLEAERRARVEAEAASHAKNEFLAVMSHELRTPLNAILGYTELLSIGIGGPLTETQRQQLARVSASGRHLLQLVGDVLDLARIESGRLDVARVPVPVAEIVNAAIVLTQPLAEGRGLELVVPAADATLLVEGDEERMRQILVNLLSNAVKFTTPGGEIAVTAERSETADPGAKLHGDGPWVGIRVRDTGIGIDAAAMEAVFAPFVQTDRGHTRARDGSGLGLTIGRRLARLMSGDITVRSARGEGSTFTLWLPAAPGTASPASVSVEQPGRDPRVRGLGDVGDVMLRELECMLDDFVDRLRAERVAPAVARLRFSQLADHVSTFVAELAAALTVLEEAGGRPSPILEDGADLRRMLAERHGRQRALLGWDEAGVRREYALLADVVQATLDRCCPGSSSGVTEARAVVERMLAEAEQASVRTLQMEYARPESRPEG